MRDHCPKCGSATPAGHAFCGGCGQSLGSARPVPLAVRRNRSQIFEGGVETTLDLRLQNVGSEPLADLSVAASSISLTAPASSDFAAPLLPGADEELCLSGFRPGKETAALVVALSLRGSTFALAGEFKIHVRRSRADANVIQITGDKNILDLARFGSAERENCEAGPDWTSVPLRWDEQAMASLIAPGTPLVVRNLGEERVFELGTAPITFGRKKETNDVVLRVSGDERKSVDFIHRNHFEIALVNGRLEAKCLGPLGMSIGPRRLEKDICAPIMHGDSLVVGNVLEFRISFERSDERVRRVLFERTR